jgi:glutamate synthase domain-containing protein 3
MNAHKIVSLLAGMAFILSLGLNPPSPVMAQSETAADGPFSQLAKLTAEGGQSEDQLGVWVAMDGDVVVVGAPGADTGGVVDSGAVYVYVKPASGWLDMVQVAMLTASDKRVGDGFGSAVAIDGDTIVVGAPMADPGGVSNAGAAYYFSKPPTGWAGNLTETGKLFASDNEVEDDFGFSVAIDGDVIAVGALDVDVGSAAWAGVVYLYLNTGAGWSSKIEDARLYASDYRSGDWFGYCVDIDGDLIAVGAKYADPGGLYAAGSAYVFVKPTGGWVTMTETARLFDANPAANDRFGGRIGISGNTVVVGADGDDPGGSVNAGAAFVFEKPAAGWSGSMTETARLTSSVKESNSWNGFGISVAIQADTIVVGSRLQDAGGVADAGVTYIFSKPVGGWQNMTESSSIMALDKQALAEFGVSAAMSGNAIVIGAWKEDAGTAANAGAAYVFDNTGSQYQTFTSVAAQDGYILEWRETSSVGRVVDVSQGTFTLGDSRFNQQYRAILSFDTSSLPDHCIVISAALKIRRSSSAGGTPFKSLKPMIADIRRPFFGSSIGLQPSDFQSLANLDRAVTFSLTPSWSWFTGSLTTGSLRFINRMGATQFRLRFLLDDDNDLQSDFVTFYSGNAPSVSQPMLIVKYLIP